MAIAICLDLDPQIDNQTIRFIGAELEEIRAFVARIADNCERSINLIQLLSTALMPLRPLIDILELLLAIVNCIFAAKKAVSQLSPAPLIGCISNLREALEKVLSNIPPLPWLRMMADIIRSLIFIVDCLIDNLRDIDAQLERIQRLVARANELSDENMRFVAACATQHVQGLQSNSLNIMRSIGVLLTTFLAIVAIFKGGSELEDVLAGQSQTQQDISNALADPAELPGLDIMLGFLLDIRSALVVAYRIVATPIGEVLGLPPAEQPTFVSGTL